MHIGIIVVILAAFSTSLVLASQLLPHLVISSSSTGATEETSFHRSLAATH